MRNAWKIYSFAGNTRTKIRSPVADFTLEIDDLYHILEVK